MTDMRSSNWKKLNHYFFSQFLMARESSPKAGAKKGLPRTAFTLLKKPAFKRAFPCLEKISLL